MQVIRTGARYGLLMRRAARRAVAVLLAATCTAPLAACGSEAARVARANRPPPAAIGAASPARSVNSLAFDLLRALGGRGNVVFSPYSVETALAMVDQGAAGQTEAQIERVLHASGRAQVGADARALRIALAAAVRPPVGTPGRAAARLDAANGLWVARGLSLEPPFASALSSDFGASPQQVDFRGQPEAARGTINAWVADRTAHLIRNLFPPGTIEARTAMVLANAIYLKAHWSSPFDPSSTARRSFVTASGRRVRVPFMTQQSAELAYAQGRDYQAVRLPYMSSTLSLLVILPRPRPRSAAAFERGLSPARVTQIVGALHPGLVALAMPRFHLQLHAGLGALLTRLGMPLAFGDGADFSGITRQTSLKISAVEHGADLLVDEHGTVASAATGISLMPTAAPGGRITRLTVDHPFLALLRDDRSGAILFVARVADPSRG